MWAVWCAAVFATVVGVIAHMLIFRWQIPFIITFVVVMAIALWSELRKVDEKKKRVYKWAYGWVNSILFAAVAATIIQIYWFQMFVIPTGSMESTLMAGDYILVNKTAYGPRVPMTPLSSTAWTAAPMAYWAYLSLRSVSLLSMYCVGSKPLTCAPSFAL